MKKEIKITPEELYYLGGLMQAKYIDYAYISAMEDIQKNYSLYESKAKTGLAKKGLLEEDFSGDMEISEEAKQLLSPIFLGEFEASMDVCYLGEETSKENIKYHFLDGKIVRVSNEERNWKIILFSEEEIIKEVQKIFQHKSEDEEKEAKVFEQEKVTEIIVLKHISIGKESLVRIFFGYDGYIYTENENEEIVAATYSNILKEAKEILLEESVTK